ncbi:MAG: hypothetical protein PHX87_02295 [Candidatus Peribacteraceae bacterium]|nr:hypothetical protein [Candidatus Peribacteraceae bacterium]MDD5742237.1 hypothetical protein [Candidatus Peribacteraceae bacterium]
MRLFRSVAGSPLVLAFAGVFSLTLAVPILTAHIQEVKTVRETALPLLASLPPLERRLSLLKEQVEVSELDAALKTGSQLERVRVSVLPAEADIPRALATLELLRSHLEDQGAIGSLSPIEVGKERPYGDGLAAVPLTFQLSARTDGLKRVLSFVRLAGLVTVGDALTTAEKNALIRATEEENPAGIVMLEQFFAADLFGYAEEPRPVEEQLKRSLQSEGFMTAFEQAVGTSLLKDAKEFFQGPIGPAIARMHLWPMEFLAIDRLEFKPGSAPDWYRLTVSLSLIRRTS